MLIEKYDNVSCMEHLRFKVHVSCMTFNHAPYIVDAMNGFTMQQTTFPFVCIIMDDASTDGEQEVISHYLENNFDLDDKAIVRNEETENYRLVFARHKTNFNCYFVVLFLKYNHYSIMKPKMQYVKEFTDTKYVAICEGDDYWITQDKLEKQVEFLERNDNFVLSYTNALFVDEHSKPMMVKNPKRYSGDCLKSLLEKGNYIVTAGVCYRKDADEGWQETRSQIPFTLLMGDKPHWIFLSTKGKFHYETQKMVCYRSLPESASHFSDIKKRMKFIDNGEQLTIFFNQLYDGGLKEESIRRNYSSARIRASFKYSWKVICKVIKTEIRNNPSSIMNMKVVILFLLRIVGVKR